MSYQEFVWGPGALPLQFVVLFHYGEARPCIPGRGAPTEDHETGGQGDVDRLDPY